MVKFLRRPLQLLNSVAVCIATKNQDTRKKSLKPKKISRAILVADVPRNIFCVDVLQSTINYQQLPSDFNFNNKITMNENLCMVFPNFLGFHDHMGLNSLKIPAQMPFNF